MKYFTKYLLDSIIKNMKSKYEKKFYMRSFSTVINVQKIVTVHYQELYKNYNSFAETHDFWELIYADKEEVYVIIDGEELVIKQGQIILIKPNVTHCVETKNKKPNIFIVSFVCRSKLTELFTFSVQNVPDNLKYLLENIMTEASKTFVLPDFDPNLRKLELRVNKDVGGEQIIKNTLELFLIYMLRTTNENVSRTIFVSKTDTSDKLQDKILTSLSENLYDYFSLNKLCEKLHYGKTYLCTTFKKKTGSSIYETFLKMKITESKKLIREGETFSVISMKLCFDSLSHFTRTFKKITGMTPNEYRASINRHK